MKVTNKERAMLVRDFILTRGKIVFPVLLVAAVAITVTIALKAGSVSAGAVDNPENAKDFVSGGNTTAEIEVPDVPLELNAYPEVNSLILSYFEAMANGDADAIASIQSSVDDMERIKIKELGKYIESYPVVDVYTKPGPEENSYIVIAYNKVATSYYPDDYLPGYASFYVCSREDGTLYINQEMVSEEITEYIKKVFQQSDVVELCNRITVEFNDVCREKPELLKYTAEVEQEVKSTAGILLAQQMNEDVSGGDAALGENDTVVPAGSGEVENPVVPENNGPVYATTTTTVNVRSSDSETADKLGKVTGGTKMEVLEQKVNGWSKVLYEGKEGYIKSEYLNLVESANGVETIGTVTASTNINVRSAASETAEKLGVAVGGETLDLIAEEGEWCKVVYNGQIGYVKAEYVEK